MPNAAKETNQEFTQGIRGTPDKTGVEESLSVEVMCVLRPEGKEGPSNVDNRDTYPYHWR